MSKKVIKNIRNFNHNPDKIYDSFTTESFIRKKLEAAGARYIFIEITEEQYAVRVNIEREMPVDAPASLQNFVPAWNKMLQKEVWQKYTDGSYSATLDIEVVGMPVKIQGVMNIEPIAEGSTIDATTEIKVNVPLVGGMVAKFISEEISKAIEEEFDFIQEKLRVS